MVASSSASSTLSKEEVDLSFENLCQELLALSASCTTLERMITQTDSQLSTNSRSGKKTKTKLERKESFADKVVSDIQRKFSTDEICGNTSAAAAAAAGLQCKPSTSDVEYESGSFSISAAAANADNAYHENSCHSTAAKQTISSQNVSAAVNNSKHSLLHENSLNTQSSTQAVLSDSANASDLHAQQKKRQKIPQPKASTFIFGTVNDHSQGMVGNLENDQQHNRYAKGDHLSQIQYSVYRDSPAKVTAGKLEALTVDVGSHVQGYRSVVQVPVRDSLVTITSPQAVKTKLSQHGKDNFYIDERQSSASAAGMALMKEDKYSPENPPPLPARNYHMVSKN